MTEAMKIVASIGPKGLGIGAFPWKDYPAGRNALVIKKSDVESARRMAAFDFEDHLITLRLCTPQPDLSEYDEHRCCVLGRF
jgi:hypothetical protein